MFSYELSLLDDSFDSWFSVFSQVIGIPSQTLGYILCIFVNALQVDVTAEIELRDIGAECKVRDHVT